MLYKIKILQHYSHKILATEQCWAAMYNLADFFLLICFIAFFFLILFWHVKASQDTVVSSPFAGCSFLLILNHSQRVLTSFRHLTSSCFSRKRVVYRNIHQHVYVLFLLLMFPSPLFSVFRKKSETPNVGQICYMENRACHTVREKLSISRHNWNKSESCEVLF